MTTPEVLAALDVAYRLDGDDATWLLRVTEALRPALDVGYGMHAFFIDATDPDAVGLFEPISVGLAADWEARWRDDWWQAFMLATPSRTLHTMLTHSACNYAVDLWQALAKKHPSFRPHLEQHAAPAVPPPEPTRVMRYPDSLNVIAVDASGIGCVFAANRQHPVTRPMSREFVRTMGHLSTHIAAAYRLRRRHGEANALAGSEAIIDHRSRVVHAEGDARASWALDAIREAAVAVGRARPAPGDEAPANPDAAIEAWRSLTAGRWTVLDHFDRDGRRYFIARPNAPEVPANGALSERERQVLGALALGHSNKLIAYELGLHPSTVSNHLATAARKLGLSSRIELARHARSLAPRPR